MFIVEGSKRKVIASILVICFMFSSCFSVLSEVAYAAEKTLGKQEKAVSENVSGDVEKNKISFEQDINKYVPFESNGKKGIILQTKITTKLSGKEKVEKEELILNSVEFKNTQIEKVIVNSESDSYFDWNYNEKDKTVTIKIENNNKEIGDQKFLVTYIYNLKGELEKPLKYNSKVDGSIFMSEKEVKETYNKEFELEEKIGDLITLEVETPETIQIGNQIANSYNKENEYKTDYEIYLNANISATDLVQNILIKDISEEFESNEKYLTESSYYKKIEIEKTNFESILGKDGFIEVYDGYTLIAKIDSNLEEVNGKYIINIEDKINKIDLKTSKPIQEGLLKIKEQKEISNTEYLADQLKSFKSLNTNYSGNIIFEGNVLNEVSKVQNKITLSKPETSAELKLSKNTLSTISENKETFTIVLNNSKISEDLYKNPSFEIEMPEYIKELTIDNISLANAEDAFVVKNAQVLKNNEGRLLLKIELAGDQVKYNSNNITSGTNITINSKLILDNYTPSKEEKIVFKVKNEKATSYKNEGRQEVKIKLEAPTGVISVNKLANYNNVGSSIESVKQGKSTDKIEIFADSKVTTSEILVMNNNSNNIKNIKILGRIPFKGNKDIKSGKDLGTTVNTKLVSRITNKNNLDVTIYYSNKAEASQEINKEENNWTTNPKDLSEIKSYLIVINNYEMKPGERVSFSYNYEIPENLEHNNNIFGTFETIFEDDKNVGISTPDIVGLTTGTGPQIKTEVKTNISDYVKEFEKVKYVINIENTGTEVIKNAIVKTSIPDRTTLVTHSTTTSGEVSKGWTQRSERELITKIDVINPGETKKVEFFVQINKLPTIEEMYANTKGFCKNEDGSYSLVEKIKDENGNVKEVAKNISELPEFKIFSNSIITADDLSKEIKIEDKGLVVKPAILVAEETISTEQDIAKVNETIFSKIKIKNNSKETMNNITVTKILPEGLNYADSYVTGYEEDGLTLKKIKNTDYNQELRTISWTIEEIKPGRTAIVNADLIVNDLNKSVYKTKLSTVSTIRVNNEEYQAGQVDIEVGKPALTIEQKTLQTNQYVKVGDEIQYIINVKNIGTIKAEKIQLTDFLPNEVKIKNLNYVADGNEVSKVVSQNSDATVYTSILPGDELEVRIGASIKPIEGKQKTIENRAEVKAQNVEKIEANPATNIIENTELGASIKNTDSYKNNNPEETKPETSKKPTTIEVNNEDNKSVKTKYEIKGIAWVDSDKNGSRDQGEKLLSGLQVKLVKSNSEEEIGKVTTNTDGEYTFEEVENGSYNIIFYYDASKYSLTDYKKNGVSDNKNSDAIAAKENNVSIATTETIRVNNGSISNIDIGLTNAETFDLNLTKTVTKITIQNEAGVKTYTFNKEALAKVDIPTKEMIGAKVLVEYNINVKNEGEIEGYAKQIVDYLPEEMEFATDLNSNWYKGNDGKLYTTELANTAISKGENKDIKLVLSISMNGENNGIITNTAEITEDYNKQGIKDVDSTPGNKDLKEDDLSTAEVAIGVKTGETLIYFSLIIAIILTGIAAVLVINKNKTKLQLKKRGV